MEAKLKHLEFLQSVITRMATNSFLFKGWTITITTGVAAFAAVETKPGLLLFGMLATVLFWGLDGYYLGLERAFRDHFEAVARLDPEQIDFSMKPKPGRDRPFRNWLNVCRSWHILAFYAAVVAINLGGILFIKPTSKACP